MITISKILPTWKDADEKMRYTYHMRLSASWDTRLHHAIIVCFHLLLLVVPFFFTWVNEELFEFNKIIVTYFLSTLIVGLWSLRMVIKGQWLVKRTPFDIPLLLFLLSQVLSTLLSLHPRTSFFGYYTRFHGGLLSTITYIGLYYAFVSNVDKKHLRGLITTLLATGLGVSLYAIPEHFGLSPSCVLITNQFDVACWVQDVQNRVFGTFGQPNWLAAYAVMLIPVGLVWGVAAAKKLQDKQLWLAWITSSALFATLLFTKSRSGFLALLMAVLVGGVIVAIGVLKQKVSVPTKLLAPPLMFLVVLALIFGTPYSPSLSQLASNINQPATQTPAPSAVPEVAPAVNRLEVGGTDSGEIRKIVWQGAIDVWKRYPVFGSGVETFAYSYYLDRPVSHNLVSEWDFLYNKAHNEFLNFAATTGTVGLLTYCLLLAWFGWWTLCQLQKKDHPLETKLLLLALLCGVIGLSVSNLLGFSTVAVSTLLFVYFAMAVVLSDTHRAWRLSLRQRFPFLFQKAFVTNVSLGAVLLAMVLALASISNWWLADYDFAYGKRLIESGQTSRGLAHLQTASRRMPNEAVFFDELALTYAQLAVAYHREGESDVVPELQTAALLASAKTLTLNPYHLNFYKNRARVLIYLSEIDETYLQEAEKTLSTATQLAPTDAKLLYNLALITQALGDLPKAQSQLEKTVAMKPNYEAAHLELGKLYENQQQLEAAAKQYEYVLTQISADNPVALERLAAVSASLSAQKK